MRPSYIYYMGVESSYDGSEYSMSGSFVVGIHFLEGGKRKNFDYSLEFVSNFKDTNGDVEMSLFNLDYNWRLFTIDKKLEPFLSFGTTSILSFKLGGKNFKTSNYWSSYNEQDGGNFYGFGFLYDKTIKFSVVKYELTMKNGYGEWEWEFLEDDNYLRFKFEITRINISYLF